MQLADFVRQGLARPGDVAVDFGTHLVQRQGRIRRHELERLLAAPAFGVDAGIDHQPGRPPHLVGQATKIGIRIGIKTHLDAEVFAVKRPAFPEGGDVEIAPELRHRLHLLCQRTLEVMAWRRLVQSERLECVEGPFVERVGIDPIGAGLQRAPGGRHITATGINRRQVVGHRLDAVRQARQPAEKGGQFAVGLFGQECSPFEQLLRGFGVETWVGAQELQEIGKAAGKSHPVDHRLHFRADPRDLLETQLVDLVGAHLEGGEITHPLLVISAAVFHLRSAHRFAGGRQVFAAEEFVEGAVGGHHRFEDGRTSGRQKARAFVFRHARRKTGEGAEKPALFRHIDDVGFDGDVITRQHHLG